MGIYPANFSPRVLVRAVSAPFPFSQSQHGGTEWNMLMAASTLVVLPVIVLFFFTQRTFIQGITVTRLKG